MSKEKYAGFWLRFVAYLVDYIVIQIAQSFIILPILAFMGITFFSAGGNYNLDSMSEEEAFAMAAAFISAISTAAFLSYILQVLYFSIMESSKYQATLGKLALGLKVTDMNGKRLDFAKAFLRNIAKIISALLLMIGYIIAGFTEKKQALHDMIASALVVKK